MHDVLADEEQLYLEQARALIRVLAERAAATSAARDRGTRCGRLATGRNFEVEGPHSHFLLCVPLRTADTKC
jgi:hypothetical protein